MSHPELLVVLTMSSTYGVAELAVINYDNILKRNAEECLSLFEACRKWGFFYLDLSRAENSEEYFALSQDVLEFSKEYFARPLDKKMSDMKQDFATFNICGYSPSVMSYHRVSNYG